MAGRVATMGAGAVGAYVGAHMAREGEDVIFVDPWPEHVEAMRSGLRITGTTPPEKNSACRCERFTSPMSSSSARKLRSI
ncbi:2-dehydropantoate 2-reductase N-terminal domain-containing protein [Acuticoccus sp.]|uniref:2-dehydropantoate 2-reductase N-terminal domain-containing protein n=1 Tax=Acuticoccus sp. TaxID=1904378 RepID=UPI003B5225B5